MRLMKTPIVSRLLVSSPHEPAQEVFEPIVEGDGFLLERIVSVGHVTSPGNWYDQDRDEWVLLLSGGARLRFENMPEPVELTPGDALLIPAHCRHRVDWTRPDCETVWLALHFQAAAASATDLS